MVWLTPSHLLCSPPLRNTAYRQWEVGKRRDVGVKRTKGNMVSRGGIEGRWNARSVTEFFLFFARIALLSISSIFSRIPMLTVSLKEWGILSGRSLV